MLGTGLVHVGDCAHLGSWSGVHRQEQHLQGRGGPVGLLYAASESLWSAVHIHVKGHSGNVTFEWPELPLTAELHVRSTRLENFQAEAGTFYNGSHEPQPM